jgi:hypothetical protein
MAIQENVGLLPHWVIQECHIVGSSLSFKWIARNFGIAPPTKNVQQLVELACHALNCQQNDGANVTERQTQNALCKIYRIHEDSISDKLFGDPVISGQSLLSISESGCVIHQPGYVPVYISCCLETEWQYQKRLVGLPRILLNQSYLSIVFLPRVSSKM